MVRKCEKQKKEKILQAAEEEKTLLENEELYISDEVVNKIEQAAKEEKNRLEDEDLHHALEEAKLKKEQMDEVEHKEEEVIRKKRTI